MSMSMDRPEALTALRTGGPDARLRAAAALRSWNDSETQGALVQALSDADPAVRTLAAETLMEVGDGASISALVPLLKSEAPAVRNGARRVLERLGRIDPGALIRLSKDEDVRMRIFAANIMGGTGDHDLAPRLVDMLDEPDPNVVDAALAALGRLGAPESVAAVARLAGSGEIWLRFSAVDALSRMPGAEAAGALLALLDRTDAEFLEPLVDAVGRQADPQAVPPLLRLLAARPDLAPPILAALAGPLAQALRAFPPGPLLGAFGATAGRALVEGRLAPRSAGSVLRLLTAFATGSKEIR
jgi:HEAT repeat protein